MRTRKSLSPTKSELLLLVLVFLNLGTVGWLWSSPPPPFEAPRRERMLAVLGTVAAAADRKDVKTLGGLLPRLEQAGVSPALRAKVGQVRLQKTISAQEILLVRELCAEGVIAAYSQAEPAEPVRSIPVSLLGWMNVLLLLGAGGIALADRKRRRELNRELAEGRSAVEAMYPRRQETLGHLRSALRTRRGLKAEWQAVSKVDFDTQVPQALTPKAGLDRLVEHLRRFPAQQIFCFVWDFDEFGRIRPAFGGQTVAEIMVETGRRVTAGLNPETDCLLHVQGRDEFQVFLCGYEAETAQTLVSRLFRSLGEPFATSQGDVLITLSGGLAPLTEEPGHQTLLALVGERKEDCDEFSPAEREAVQQTVSHWLDLAEQYLYQAKQAGKNQIFAQTGRIVPCDPSHSPCAE